MVQGDHGPIGLDLVMGMATAPAWVPGLIAHGEISRDADRGHPRIRFRIVGKDGLAPQPLGG